MNSSNAKKFDFEELGKFKDMDKAQLHEAVKSGKVDGLIDRMEEYANHPTTVKKLTSLMISVDKSAPIRHFRTFWNKLPQLAQWAIMHGTKGPMMMSSNNGPIELMIKNGFINYKGHLNENGEIMEEKIQAMGGMNKYLLKYGVKIGKYFVPELKEVEPFVEPMLKLQNLGDKTMEKVRHAVRAARETREEPKRNIQKISSDVRSNLQTLNFLPQEPANTNIEAEIIPIRRKQK